MTREEAIRQTFDYAREQGRTHVSIVNLGGICMGLRSEPDGGENVEYDRALAEVMTEALGLSMDHKQTVGIALGLVTVDRW